MISNDNFFFLKKHQKLVTVFFSFSFRFLIQKKKKMISCLFNNIQNYIYSLQISDFLIKHLFNLKK